eukprot:CAMPEP_0197180276 /NCGR_PEP_ID=MMETSP1423-20130617/4935_1 /TAXON_ID=476441 /ORGANISM="Pseudo-nitzschia heimii, Strain UNC1101" /LENGTH=411 /DNA_ID=CAMNT_0042630321 /DNA_START=228 /DNA_END=1463 /DNA_ORIENTATION=+
MPKRAAHISTDRKSSNDIFAHTKHHQSMDEHGIEQCREASGDTKCEHGNKRLRRRRKSLERKQPSHNNSTNDIFADPNKQQTIQQNIRHRRPNQERKLQSSLQIAKQSLKQPQQPVHTRSQQAHEIKGRKQKQHRQEISRATDTRNDESCLVLDWNSPVRFVPLSEEESIVKVIFQRHGQKERGMMKGKPSFVVRKYEEAMRQCAPSMNLPQVLSLRRHHIKLFNQFKNMTALGLGSFDDINESARIFESAVEKFLRKSSIDFLTEEDQRRAANEDTKVLRATPDFLLPKPVLLRKIRKKKRKKGKSIKNYDVIEERTIHWIEAKMYYGASSIPHGSKGAVGTIMSTARKYFKHFGEGAILFMMGCGDKLAADLNDIGVSVMDCAGNTVCLDPVHNHQRTWCANKKGRILP